MGELASRRAETDRRVDEFRQRLESAADLAKDKACVYATGSFGRGEAGNFSDPDLFILGKNSPQGGSLLRRLDEICIKAELIEATRGLGIPEFSGDGRYLVHYSVEDFTKTLGAPEDDVTNTFTARLLLLLESRPLVGDAVYQEATDDVVAAYWRDYEDHKTNFMPAFLANDILRLWRTFCVNYEARSERQPEEKKAKGKLKNYKLKHSRLLICYSALLYLLAVYGEHGRVSPVDAARMTKLTPTERLEWLLAQARLASAHGKIKELLRQYEVFLETTNAEESTLIAAFADKNIAKERLRAASEFGNSMFDALTLIGGGSPFHRMLVV